MRKRALMLGGGGMGWYWIREILPVFRERLQVVGLVDVDQAALDRSGDVLDLEPSQRFVSLERAFDAVEADCCIVVLPAAVHARAVRLAAARSLPVLCEKPLADTWANCLDIYSSARAADLKVQVVQNYRYRAPMLAMRAVLASGELGRLNYMVARFADDCREYDSWRRRHELPHAMLMDGAAHHFDMLRNLSGANCASIASLEWNPAWSSSRGEFNALCLLRMTTGAGAVYEGSATAAGQQNAWRQEYYRAECEAGSVTVDADQVVRIHRHTPAGGLRTEEVPLETPRYEGHEWIVHEFLDWLDGGPPPATVLEDNIHSAAMVFGAIEAAATRQWVDLASLMTGAPG
jgi:predicted dehydrogenase